MLVLGFLLLALAVAAAIVAIVQNPHATMSVDVLGTNHTMHAYWVFVAGMVVLAVAAIGVSMMRSGAAHNARNRRERRDLAAENARLNQRMTADGRVDAEPVAADGAPSRTRHTWGGRTHRTV